MEEFLQDMQKGKVAIIASSLMAIVGIIAVSYISVRGECGNNLTSMATILGFIAPTIAGILAYSKATEAHETGMETQSQVTELAQNVQDGNKNISTQIDARRSRYAESDAALKRETGEQNA